jgi:hypothetical protein
MMYKTKMIKVYLPGLRLSFSLIVNFLFLIMQPFRALANYDDLTLKLAQADKPQAANPTVSPTALEPKILSEINRVRTNPQGYAQWLEEQQQYYDGIWLRLPGEKPVRTNRGRKALEEAIAVLKAQQPLSPLSIAEGTAVIATNKLEDFATANNIQYISYGRVTAEGIVMGLVVDDLFPDRRRRNSLLDPDAKNTGVACKPDPRYARVCAIAYSDTASAAEIAEAGNTLQSTATALPNSEVNDIEAEEPTTDSVSLAESLPTVAQDDPNTAESLPEPPPPQAPPALPTPNEPDSIDSATDDVEAEPEEVEIQADEPEIQQAEAEIAELELDEPPEETAESTPSQEDIEASQADESEVAVDSDSSRLLERVERGSLEEGDRVISDDGSFYDSYPLEGKAGESFGIYLESDEFDSFVALVDAKGNIVEQNDDVSQEDSNSRIRVTLPEDGVYNIIVNTYDEGGTGNYVLTVSR